MSALIECRDEMELVCSDCGVVIRQYVPPASLGEMLADENAHAQECDGDDD
jgi:hypothetical protein